MLKMMFLICALFWILIAAVHLFAGDGSLSREYTVLGLLSMIAAKVGD